MPLHRRTAIYIYRLRKPKVLALEHNILWVTVTACCPLVGALLRCLRRELHVFDAVWLANNRLDDRSAIRAGANGRDHQLAAASKLEKQDVICVILMVHRMPKVACKVVDLNRFPRTRIGERHHKCLLRASRKRIANPFAGCADRTAIHAAGSWHGIRIPRTRRIRCL